MSDFAKMVALAILDLTAGGMVFGMALFLSWQLATEAHSPAAAYGLTLSLYWAAISLYHHTGSKDRAP